MVVAIVMNCIDDVILQLGNEMRDTEVKQFRVRFEGVRWD